MLGRRQLMLTVMAGSVGLMASPVLAQEAAQPADGTLPEVEVIQQKAAPVAKKKAAPAPKQTATPTPQPPAYDYVDAEPPAPGPGERGADGRVIGNAPNISPVDPSQGVLPTDLQDYAGAGTRVTSEQIEAQRPQDNHELLTRVPGVMVVNDDGMARHSNIGVRGSPVRRSRKVLIMEDGLPLNFSPYLDPSTHYTPPTERIESVEVLRGTVVAYGPLTNHGVVNFRNLDPFGPNETVIKAALGYTEGSDKSVNNFRHVHTRQNIANVGVVASYTGSEAGGAWDNEELRYNDFYGALGFRGSNQDLKISGGYFRQRDDYDEDNFEDGDALFFANGRDKAAFRDFAHLSTYNADYYRIQAAHNLYIDSDTTLSTRLFYSNHERNRFYHQDDDGAGNFFMRGREREYEFYGADSRIEFARLPLFGGMTHDLQAGVRGEHHNFTNCNTVGAENEVLKASNSGRCDLFVALPEYNGDRSRRADIEADVFSAFIQTAIHVTPNLVVTPGVRFENYDIDRNSIRAEAPQQEGRTSSDHDHVLPGIAFAWEAMPRTTIYGGFHQGITPQITRGPAFPLPDEKGDNYQIGVRSTAIRGFSFDVAYFHSFIDDYQVKSPISTAGGNNIFGTVDEVEINGVELAARLESRPFTGGPWNFFGEAVYTYADSIIKSGDDAGVDVSGNRVPEVPKHFANLTLGFAHAMGFDASVTWTYRGDFFVDAENTVFIPNDSTVGLVDDVWLLSARANYHIPNTNLTLFVSGQNLTDEFYIADRSDGAKPGVGRTLWAGFTWKFDHD